MAQSSEDCREQQHLRVDQERRNDQQARHRGRRDLLADQAPDAPGRGGAIVTDGCLPWPQPGQRLGGRDRLAPAVAAAGRRPCHGRSVSGPPSGGIQSVAATPVGHALGRMIRSRLIDTATHEARQGRGGARCGHAEVLPRARVAGGHAPILPLTATARLSVGRSRHEWDRPCAGKTTPASVKERRSDF
jgi:hypothetical protein